MDEHDKQFESYLRQFQLRQPGPVPEIATLKRRSSVKWGLAAAAAVVFVAASSILFVRNSGNVAGPKATVEAAGNPSMYRVGETIEAGSVIRSNSAVGLVLALEDGSQVEVHAQSELKLESAADGIRVRLNEGSILVTAAKQGAGHLYVQTRDAMVSVVGTVFLVNAEQAGTTVAVVEGEVHVQQGTELKKLHPGEQFATNPASHLKPIAEQISWSRSATEYVALLQQAPGIAPPTTQPVAAPQTGPPVVVPADQGQNDTFDLIARYNERTRPSIPFKVQANYLRVTRDQVRTLITTQITNRDLTYVDEGGGKKASVHITGVLYRDDNRRLPGFSQDVALEFPSNTFAANLDQPTLYQESRYLTPGRYRLHVTVEDKNSQGIGAQDYPLNVPRIPDQVFATSSMILAYSVTDMPPGMLPTDMFALGKKRVKPNASGVFRTDESLNIWQEIYGLATDKYSGKPSVTFEWAISHDNEELRKRPLNITEPPGTERMTYTDSVSLVTFAPGAYELQLKVTDNLAMASLVTTGKFSVVSAQTQSEPTRENPGRATFYRACSTCHVADLTGLRNYSTKAQFADLVSRQRTMGAGVSDADVPALVDYLFETYGKKADPPVPSDIPLQRQTGK